MAGQTMSFSMTDGRYQIATSGDVILRIDTRSTETWILMNIAKDTGERVFYWEHVEEGRDAAFREAFKKREDEGPPR
jgi:hypothetical protein